MHGRGVVYLARLLSIVCPCPHLFAQKPPLDNVPCTGYSVPHLFREVA